VTERNIWLSSVSQWARQWHLWPVASWRAGKGHCIIVMQ
jgi:hypothetical protein